MTFFMNNLLPYFKGKKDFFSPLMEGGTIALTDKPKENESFVRSHKELILITCLVGMSSLAINYTPRLVSFASLAALALSQGGVYSAIGLGSLGALALRYFGLHNSSLGSFLTTAIENVKGAKTQVTKPTPTQGPLDKPAPVSTLVTNRMQDLAIGPLTPHKTPPPSKPADATPAIPKPKKERSVEGSGNVKLTPKEIRMLEAVYQAGAVHPCPTIPTQPRPVTKRVLGEKSKKGELTAKEIEELEKAYKQSNRKATNRLKHIQNHFNLSLPKIPSRI